MRPLVTALVLAASAILSLACGQEEEAVQPAATETATPFATSAPTVAPATPSPAVNGQLWRWVNVTVFVPEGSRVTIGRGTIPEGLKGAGGPGLGPIIDHGGDPEASSYVIIDAITGEILQDHVSPEDQAAIDEVLKTLALSPFDEAVKGWPYADHVPANAERRADFGMSYIVPDPASGMTVGGGIADSFGESGGGGGPFLEISNGRSTMLIGVDTRTGELRPDAVTLSPQDGPSFDRFVSTVQICRQDVQC